MQNRLNICYFNFIYAKGHRRLDTSFIEALSSFGEVVCFSPPGWYAFNSKNIIMKEFAKEIRTGSKFPRFQLLYTLFKNVRNVTHIIKKQKFDAIVVGESEIIAFPFYMLMCGKHIVRKTVVIHHNDLDSADSRNFKNKLRRRIFDLYKNSIVNCIMEPFMREALIRDYDVRADRIVCWKHTLPLYQNKAKTGYDCVGISESNDELKIQQLISCEDRDKIFKNANLHVLLRSKKTEYNNGYLTVKLAKERFSDEEYRKLFATAKVIFIPLPETFNNRVSGNVYDAFAAGVPVIASDVPCIRYLIDTYGDICEIYDPETFADTIKVLSNKRNSQMESFRRFQDDHSLWRLLESMQETFDLIAGAENEKNGYM